MKTGFNELDKVINLEKSELIVVGARPAMGKSTFVFNVATNVAKKQHIPVLLFDLEMSKEQIINRIIASEALIRIKNINALKLKDEEWKRIDKVTKELSNVNLYIDDTPNISIEEIEEKCIREITEKNIGLVVVDYLQLIRLADKSKVLSREQEISEISGKLKKLSQKLNVPIIAVSQLSRAPENRENHRPLLSDLHESSAIVQDANVVMFIYRDSYYKLNMDVRDVAEIIVAKNRCGDLGSVNLNWLEQYPKFENID